MKTREPTDEQMDKILDARGTSLADLQNVHAVGRDVIKQCIRDAFALAAEPAEPVTPDRAGQWFVRARDPKDIYGPIVRSVRGSHYTSDGPGESLAFCESDVEAGRAIRIPPPPVASGFDLGEGE